MNTRTNRASIYNIPIIGTRLRSPAPQRLVDTVLFVCVEGGAISKQSQSGSGATQTFAPKLISTCRRVGGCAGCERWCERWCERTTVDLPLNFHGKYSAAQRIRGRKPRTATAQSFPFRCAYMFVLSVLKRFVRARSLGYSDVPR